MHNEKTGVRNQQVLKVRHYSSKLKSFRGENDDSRNYIFYKLKLTNNAAIPYTTNGQFYKRKNGDTLSLVVTCIGQNPSPTLRHGLIRIKKDIPDPLSLTPIKITTNYFVAFTSSDPTGIFDNTTATNLKTCK